MPVRARQKGPADNCRRDPILLQSLLKVSRGDYLFLFFPMNIGHIATTPLAVSPAWPR